MVKLILDMTIVTNLDYLHYHNNAIKITNIQIHTLHIILTWYKSRQKSCHLKLPNITLLSLTD